MPRYSTSNVPTAVAKKYSGSGVFRGRLGDTVYPSVKVSGGLSVHLSVHPSTVG